MQITFDTTNPSDLNLLAMLFNAQPGLFAQPEVANTGTTATGFNPLSPEGSGVSGEAETSTASPAPVKKTRAKKEAAPVVEPTPEVAEPEVVAEIANDNSYSLDDVRASLQAFTAAKGVPAGIEVLKKFNAGRISELDESNYAAFVQECAL